MYTLDELIDITNTEPTDADGCCADIWYLSDTLVLKRIQTSDIASMSFMWYCWDNHDDKHLPVMEAVRVDDEYCYIVIEKLHHCLTLQEYVKSLDLGVCGLDGKKFAEYYGESFKESLDKLTEMYNNDTTLNEVSEWDLHYNNLMIRSCGTPVITDPFGLQINDNVNYYDIMIDRNLLHPYNEMHPEYDNV